MHDELRAHGARRAWWWRTALVVLGALDGVVLVALALVDPGWPPADAGVAGGWTAVVGGAVAGAVLTVVLFVVEGDRWSWRRAWPTRAVLPAPDLVGLVEGAALARGEPVPRVWRLASRAPNVACLPGPAGRHLVVSAGAEAGFARAELEALAALQFSLVLDPAARRVRRTLVTACRMVTWTLRFLVVAMVVSLVRHLPWAGLTINLVVWTGFLLCGVLVLVVRRLRWSWGLVGDGVAVETTRHPAPLAAALRRLAGYNGEQVPVRRTFGAADPYWAAPVRGHVSVATAVSNGRARSRRSAEQVSDAALLLRARIVERVGVAGEAATLAAWRDAAATFERLGRYGGTQEGDGTVDGVLVTTEGAEGGTTAAGEPWPEVADGEPAGHRPRWPRPDDLAAYDRAATR